jgi:hypothetical protein
VSAARQRGPGYLARSDVDGRLLHATRRGLEAPGRRGADHPRPGVAADRTSPDPSAAGLTEPVTRRTCVRGGPVTSTAGVGGRGRW